MLFRITGGSSLMITAIVYFGQRVNSFIPSRLSYCATRFTSRTQVLKGISEGTMTIDLPTLDEVKKDPFAKQVSHASKVVTALASYDDDDESLSSEEKNYLSEVLSAQLSHSDGIRGFFVSYLTSTDEGSAVSNNNLVVPPSLVAAMAESNKEELIPLACMNVIMPTAMITMHTDPHLSAESSKTAERGKEVLAALKTVSTHHQETIEGICDAIYAVATASDGKNCSEEQLQYWTSFFEKWGYKEQQKNDIAKAITKFM